MAILNHHSKSGLVGNSLKVEPEYYTVRLIGQMRGIETNRNQQTRHSTVQHSNTILKNANVLRHLVFAKNFTSKINKHLEKSSSSEHVATADTGFL